MWGEYPFSSDNPFDLQSVNLIRTTGQDLVQQTLIVDNFHFGRRDRNDLAAVGKCLVNDQTVYRGKQRVVFTDTDMQAAMEIDGHNPKQNPKQSEAVFGGTESHGENENCEIPRKNAVFLGSEDLSNGRYWTRTNDLNDVNVAL